MNMKKLILLLALFLFGCGSISKFDYQPGQVLSSSIGSPMIRWVVGTHMGVQKYGKEMELVYSGKTNSTVKIAYREYAYSQRTGWGDDLLARPAFSQDLTYDLAESKQIAFQDIVLEVKDATNSQISFSIAKAPKLE